MADPSTPPGEAPGAAAEATLATVLADGGELAFGVRLRIALDVLEAAAGASAPLSRRTASSRMRIANVRVGSQGSARVAGEGSPEGAAEILWEIIAGRELGEGPPKSLSEVAGDAPSAITELIDMALRGEGPTT